MSYSRKTLLETDWAYQNNSSSCIQAACLQDIALSMRAMAKNHVELVMDLDRFKRWYKEEQARAKGLERRNASLRGVITKLKRKGGTA